MFINLSETQLQNDSPSQSKPCKWPGLLSWVWVLGIRWWGWKCRPVTYVDEIIRRASIQFFAKMWEYWHFLSWQPSSPNVALPLLLEARYWEGGGDLLPNMLRGGFWFPTPKLTENVLETRLFLKLYKNTFFPTILFLKMAPSVLVN